MLIRWQTTSPESEPSFLMSTRSLAVMLPFTLPRTTSSLALMLAWICPLRPTVTRFPGRLMVPSTRPSMYSDSEPVTSPLITRDLPMVACSVLLTTALRGAATGVGSFENVGVVLITVFSGSGVVVGFAFWFGFGLGVLAGFHIQVIPFAFGCCSAQALLRLLNLYFRHSGGTTKEALARLLPMFRLSATIPKLLDWRCFSAMRPRPCAQTHRNFKCNYSRYSGNSYIGHAP